MNDFVCKLDLGYLPAGGEDSEVARGTGCSIFRGTAIVDKSR